MSKFKVGDRVVRLFSHHDYAWLEFCRHVGIRPDLPVSITKVIGSSGIVLLGADNRQWEGSRFVLAAAASQQPLIHDDAAETDAVNSPQHYQFFPDLEAIVVIARSMPQEQFYGYCLGNRLKYRLRAGNKDKLEQDIAKSDKYLELYEQHKEECIDAK